MLMPSSCVLGCSQINAAQIHHWFMLCSQQQDHGGDRPELAKGAASQDHFTEMANTNNMQQQQQQQS